MVSVDVVIIGGGLSGLMAALRLTQQGLERLVVIEARPEVGGRLLSLSSGMATDVMATATSATSATSAASAQGHSAPRYDLGATWFWPELQPELPPLLRELGLDCFPQFEQGDMLVERARGQAPSRMAGYPSMPAGWRIAGGMAAVTDALRQRLPAGQLIMGQRVTQLTRVEDGVVITTQDAQGRSSIMHAAHVMLALPPRLASETISFTPALPASLQRQWQQCATWMAPHAKYLAVYDTPFWRDDGLSGEARSAVGPMGEMHDASPPAGEGALFGFIGVPAHIRRQHPESALRAACRAQLVRLFGEAAAAPKAEFLKDWSSDPHTAVAADLMADGDHPATPAATADAGPWQDRIIGIGSEWSPRYPGYAAGAVDAATRGVDRLAMMRAARGRSAGAA